MSVFLVNSNYCFSLQIGREFEDEIFQGLQSAIKENKNTIVLLGLTLKSYNQKRSGEFDFIAISLPSKSIVQIEAKRGNSKNNRDHAERQLNRGQAFFEENIPFPSSENWKYVKMICFGESVEKDICENCKPFVLGSNFFEGNSIQSVSEEIADQFRSFLKTLSDGNYAGKVSIFKINFYKKPFKNLSR